MLRFAFLTALTITAASSDDQSFMQVSSTALEVSSAIQKVGEAMSELPYPGKMRQMAIDALMKSVSTVEKLDADAVALLNEIVDLLDEILTEMRASQAVDQNEINYILQLSTNCETTYDEGVPAAKQAAESKATEHATCRVTEDVDFGHHATECGKVTSYQNDNWKADEPGASLQHCSAVHSLDSLTQWDEWFKLYANIYKSASAQMTLLAPPCNSARDDLETQKEICDGLQHSYENLFCTWWLKQSTECTQKAACHANGVTAYNTLKATKIEVSDKRVNEARVIVHVKCLLTELIGGSADLPGPCTASTAAAETGIVTDYGVIIKNVPPIIPCSTADVDVYPGEGTFADVFYHGATPPIAHTVDVATSCSSD